jgi:hypothetical protein
MDSNVIYLFILLAIHLQSVLMVLNTGWYAKVGGKRKEMSAIGGCP